MIQTLSHFYISYSKVEISHCVINNNCSTGYGGGIYITRSESQISNCVLKHNYSTLAGGGICCSWNTIIQISNTSIFRNHAIGGGGGICITTESEVVLVALQNGIYAFDPETGSKKLLVNPEEQLPNNRFNDGKCDSAGRFWAGTMSTVGEKNAGTLYRLSDNQQELVFTVVQNRSLDIHMGGTAEPITWDNLALQHADGSNNEQMVATYCALHKKLVHIESVYDDEHFNFEGTKNFDSSTGYHSKSMLVIPLLNSSHELLGVLQLINKIDDKGNSAAFTHADQQNASALASQAAISLTNSLLIKELETLFESVISTITKAFDEKCSFTGGHVRLVAELSGIIAEGIHQDKTVYKDINYSPDNLHEIRIAALLHDVGKISTPEFIMQKSTKLEKLLDRIDWISERFEILKRDAQIEYLQNKTADNKAKYETKINQLDSQLEFIAQCNKGGRYLQDADLQRIEDIASQRIVINGKEMPLLNEDEKQNLSIRAGTLNQQEREKIMDHARVSLEILSTLPFPKKYKRVVNIAANHHEKLDGSGYPRGLTDAEIGFEDRILILADLYEALSSKDRPYKEPNPLSQIFKILISMANDGHIDKKLLRFFYESGTYKVFNQYLTPNQIDDITFDLED